ncbi:MAG: MCE family protein [Candidatus Omnitrophica bacterium]|nr:MCE family protein [Candidatus Omnitrophota bacterium]
MKKGTLELMVGMFIVAGFLAMAYISIKLGQIEIFNRNYYSLNATFPTVNGLRKDTNIEIAGVPVGKVKEIQLKDNQAIVILDIKKEISIQDDAIAAIRTKGLLGDKYIEILPGGSNTILKAGDEIFNTEPPFDILLVIKNMALTNNK